jgi:hypothetical protein
MFFEYMLEGFISFNNKMINHSFGKTYSLTYILNNNAIFEILILCKTHQISKHNLGNQITCIKKNHIEKIMGWKGLLGFYLKRRIEKNKFLPLGLTKIRVLAILSPPLPLHFDTIDGY